MGSEIDRLEIKIQSQASQANKQLDALSAKLSSLSQVLSRIDSSGLTGMAKGVSRLAKSMQEVKGARASDFTRLANNIQKVSNINTAGLNNTASSLSHISRAFNSVGAASKNVQGISALSANISKLGGANVQKAVDNMPKLAASLKQLMSTLASAPNVSKNVLKMTNALANLAANGSKAGAATRSINNSLGATKSSAGKSTSALSRLSNAMSSLTLRTNRADKSTRSLAASFGMFYATMFPIIRGIKALGRSIEKSMDYIETYNYFNVTMDKIAKENKSMYSKMGYDSADSYADSFKSRLNGLTEKMSGYKVGSDGMLDMSGIKNLNLDPEQIMSYQANVAAVTNSVGLVGETSVNASKALSMLAADMSSLKNIDMKTVMTNFQSGLIGQSRALYKYGIDMFNVFKSPLFRGG